MAATLSARGSIPAPRLGPAGAGDGLPFVGRVAELNRLQAALRPGAVLFVAGRASVGKTALASQLVLKAEQAGCPAWTADGGPLAPLARAGGPPSGPSCWPEVKPSGLVYVDDTHLLTDRAAATLQELRRDDTLAFLLTVNTAIPAALPATAPSAVEAFLHLPATWLELGPLPEQDLQVLIEAMLGAPCETRTLRRLTSVCEGQLSFLRELLTLGYQEGRLHLEGGVFRWRGSFAPAGRLAAVVDARIGPLEPAQRDALELLALAEPLELDLAQRLVDPSVWVELERRQLVIGRCGQRRVSIAYANALYRERVGRLTPAARRTAHRARLVQLLSGAPSRRRGDRARAVNWALNARATLPASELTAGARDAWNNVQLQPALKLATLAYRAEPSVAAALLLSDVLTALGRAVEAEELLAGSAPGRGPRPGGPELTIRRAANLAFGLSRPREALELLASAAGKPGPSDVRALPDPGADGVGPAVERGRTATLLVYATSDLGRSADALTAADRYRPLMHAPGTLHPWVVAEFDLGRWRALIRLGRLNEADEWAGERAAGCRAVESNCERIWTVALGLGALHRGQVRSAFQQLSEALSDDCPLPPFLQLTYARGLAEASAYCPGPSAGRQATIPPDWTEQSLSHPWRTAWLAVARRELISARAGFADIAKNAAARGQLVQEVDALDALVRIGAGRASARRLVTVAAQADGPRAGCVGRRAQGLLEDDPAQVASAADGFADLGMLLAAAESAYLAGDLHTRQHQPALARQEVARAEQWHARCEGATIPASAGAAAGAALSSRERQIAALATTLTSPAIAQRLGLSVRTVETHLNNCYLKLGLHGRSELTSVFRPPAPPGSIPHS